MYTVSFTQEDIGTMNRLDVSTPIIVKAVQKAGYSVANVTRQPGAYIVSLTITGPAATASGLFSAPGRQAVLYAVDGTDPLSFFTDNALADQDVWDTTQGCATPTAAAAALEQAGWRVESVAPTGDGRTAIRISR
jgi:hypothetical protein